MWLYFAGRERDLQGLLTGLAARTLARREAPT